MSWKDTLFKPRWRHRRPEVRAQAVAEAHDAGLLDALPGIAVEDESPDVRLAAVRRLEDPRAVQRALAAWPEGADPGPVVERLRALCSAHEGALPPLEARRAIVSASDDRELLERVALHAPEAELRSVALQRVDRQGFLGDRAIEDPDAAVRRTAADRIEQRSTLRRVIEALRTRDKALHQALAERLENELLAEGDPDAVRHRAETLCAALERLARADTAAEETVLAEHEAAWAAIDAHAPAPLAARFRNTLERLRQPPETAKPAAGGPVAASQPDTDSESVSAGPEPEAAGPAAAADVESPGAGVTPEDTTAGTSEPDVAPPQTAEAEPESVAPALAQAGEALLGGLASEKADPRQVTALEKAWRKAWRAQDKPTAGERALKARVDGALAERAQRIAEADSGHIDAVGPLLDRLAGEIEDGELVAALKTRGAIQAHIDALAGRRLPGALAGRLGRLQGRLREIRDWQHWANDKVRDRLLDEMRALPTVDLHPDAVLERMRALQAEWKALDAGEQIPGDRRFNPNPGAWRQFQDAGNETFEAIKPFLEKRSEIRDRHKEDTEQVAAQLAEMARADDVDFAALRRALGEARAQLRSLDGVPPRHRHKLATRLKQAMEVANDRIGSFNDAIEREKRKLIRAAAALGHAASLEDAIGEAKSLQAQWKRAGSLPRRREQSLWEEFRAHLDPLFEQQKAERAGVEAEARAAREAQQAVLGRLDEMLALSDEELAEHMGKVQGLQDEWSEFRAPERGLQRRFDEALARVGERLEQRLERERDRARDRVRAKSALLDALDAASAAGSDLAAVLDEVSAQWPETEAAHGHDERYAALERRFDERLGRWREGAVDAPSPADEQAARLLCVRAEFLAGEPSPAEDRDLRMRYQVERLSESLAGGPGRSAHDEAAAIECEWLGLRGLPEAARKALAKRMTSAIKKIK